MQPNYAKDRQTPAKQVLRSFSVLYQPFFRNGNPAENKIYSKTEQKRCCRNNRNRQQIRRKQHTLCIFLQKQQMHQVNTERRFRYHLCPARFFLFFFPKGRIHQTENSRCHKGGSRRHAFLKQGVKLLILYRSYYGKSEYHGKPHEKA